MVQQDRVKKEIRRILYDGGLLNILRSLEELVRENESEGEVVQTLKAARVRYETWYMGNREKQDAENSPA